MGSWKNSSMVPWTVTFTYSPQEYAGQLSSCAAEVAEYRGYTERVPDRFQKRSIAANVACNLAISGRAAADKNIAA